VIRAWIDFDLETALRRRSDGRLQLLPLEEAKLSLDHIWDHAFHDAHDKGI